jgi:Flp pilus assembly protein protease CpaA
MKEILDIFRKAARTEMLILSLIYISACAVLIATFDDPVLIVKGCLFFLFLTGIAFLDFKTMTIPNLSLIPVAAVGLINFDWTSISGAFIVSVPMLLIAALFGHIGGGDIKFLAVTGFVLKPDRALISALTGFLLFILVHCHQKHQEFPYAPCLSVGCFLAFLL